MDNLFKIKYVTLKCDKCKERPIVDTFKVSPGVWLGLCDECKPGKKEGKNDN